MLIDVSNLKDGQSLNLEHRYEPEECGLGTREVRYLDSLKLDGRLERIKSELAFRGALQAKIELICSRCLKTVVKDLCEKFELYYPFHAQHNLETTDDIRDVMILAYPVKFVCGENCKGLCPSCGENLNSNNCHCQVVETEEQEINPFEKLADWYKEKKN